MAEVTANTLCCPTGPIDAVDLRARMNLEDARASLADAGAWVQTDDTGISRLNLVVENMHCPACIATIERAAQRIAGVTKARANLSTRRLYLEWRADETDAEHVVEAVANCGYRVTPFDPVMLNETEDRESRALLQALAIAGFGAANVMLLSVGSWAGVAQGMAPETKALLHWISALIALPCVGIGGMPFFKSAFSSLRHGRLNMDVPISLAVVTAAALSLYEISRAGDLVYFDASVTLLFFLLIGRFLERRVRGKARSAAENLLLMRARAATVIGTDGSRISMSVDEIVPGMIVHVAVGDQIPVDGMVMEGESSLDTQMITGESIPRLTQVSDLVHAGMINLTNPLMIKVTAAGEQTLLADVVRLMEEAEKARSAYVRLADRMARAYAPAVHLLGVVTFIGWMSFSSISVADALMIALSVLIVTCPCALGLAVPAVQVGAVGSLLRKGVLVKSGDALERLSEVDRLVLDKTGTLTLGLPVLINELDINKDDLRLAASLAASSRHPLSRAVCRAASVAHVRSDVREQPGAGLSVYDGQKGLIRLGSRHFCDVGEKQGVAHHGAELWLSVQGRPPVQFLFEDQLRPDMGVVLNRFREKGIAIEILSGDRYSAVSALAKQLDIDCFKAEQSPKDKIDHLQDLACKGQKVWMIGDGLNDAPALAAAHVSASPAMASDVSQTAADIIVQGDSLIGLGTVYDVACSSRKLIIQNFALALGYNCIAVPLAMAGFINPLFAAIAMSASSIVVTVNSLRVRLSSDGMSMS